MASTIISKIVTILISLNLVLCFMPAIETNAVSSVETLISIAEKQIGTEETGTNNVKYNTWYYKKEVNGSAYPWCAVFVAWCANQAGISNNTIPQTQAQGAAGCDEGVAFFSSKGRFRNSLSQGGNYTPSRGDIIYFSKGHTLSDSTHVGIVTGVSNGYVNTIEGNKNTYIDNGASKKSDGIVWSGSYSLSDAYIIGYGIPDYSEIPPSNPEPNGEKYIVSTESSNLNIRSSPSTSADIIGKAPKGTVVILIEKVSGGTWAKVYYNGITGYCSMDYLTPQGGGNDLQLPYITTDKEFYKVGETAHISWKASNSTNLSHYWLIIEGPNGTLINQTMNLKTSYDFVIPENGTYVITTLATPKGSTNGEGSKTDVTQIFADSKPTLFIDKNNITIDMDKNKGTNIEVSYNFLTDDINKVDFSFSQTNPAIVELSWSPRYGYSQFLIINAKRIGETDITVTLNNAETGAILDSKKVHVVVSGTTTFGITQWYEEPINEYSEISLNLAEGEYTYGYIYIEKNAPIGTINCTATNNSVVSVEWNNDNRSSTSYNYYGFKICPKKAGNERITFSYVSDGIIISTAYIDIFVYTECTKLYFHDKFGVSEMEAQPGEKIGDYMKIIKHPHVDGKPDFIGWYSQEYGGNKYTEDMIIESFDPINLYAHYEGDPSEDPNKENTDPTEPTAPIEPEIPDIPQNKKMITLTFIKNTSSQIDLNFRTIKMPIGDSIEEYLPKIPEQYKGAFDGWYTSKSGGNRINSNYEFNNNSPTTMLLYAHWKNVNGDANYDGEVNVADAVMLQKWLLGYGELTCWQNVDLYKDERIDVFDLCLMKRALLEQ